MSVLPRILWVARRFTSRRGLVFFKSVRVQREAEPSQARVTKGTELEVDGFRNQRKACGSESISDASQLQGASGSEARKLIGPFL